MYTWITFNNEHKSMLKKKTKKKTKTKTKNKKAKKNKKIIYYFQWFKWCSSICDNVCIRHINNVIATFLF